VNNLILYKSENFQDIKCDFWKNENDDIFMTSEQLGMVLGYSQPRKAINTIVSRNNYIKNSKYCSDFTLMSEVGLRDFRLFTEKGIYEIAMLAQTNKAKEFRSWVSDLLIELRKKEIILLKTKIIELQPKLELYEQCINAQNNLTMLQASKILKTSRNKLFSLLRRNKILMNKGERHNIPYQQYIDRGLFTVVVKTIYVGNNQILNISVTLVSAKGLKFIQKIILKEKEKLLEAVYN